MKIGVLTGGGDAPGLNAAIRAVVIRGIEKGYEIVGIRDGWKGLLSPPQIFELKRKDVEDIYKEGGTILGSSRTNPFAIEGGSEQIIKNLEKLEINALIAMGGEDTLGVAAKLYEKGARIVGVPKTIDRDLNFTDYTLGFDTATQTATNAIERLHSTAKSHHRIIVVELMGRQAGWITLMAGLAGGAHAVLIPEVPLDLDGLCERLVERKKQGKSYAIIAVSEGVKVDVLEKVEKDAFGHINLSELKTGERIAKLIQKKTGIETRAVVLGHIQRSGAPTSTDRIWGTRLGAAAIDFVDEGRFGKMAAVKGEEITPVDLKKATEGTKTVNAELYELARSFFG